MNNALVVGGSNGIGLAVAIELAKENRTVFLVDRREPSVSIPKNIHFIREDLLITDFKWLDELDDVNTLFYSAGFGRVAHFDELHYAEIDNSFRVNAIAPFRILHHFMPRIKSHNPFYCGMMVSIAGRIASPLFSIYSATKAALFRGIEAINTELKISGTPNRITEISPGSIKGTSFNGRETELDVIKTLASTIICSMKEHDVLFIPDFEDTYRNVIARYSANHEQFAESSYKYKIEQGRLQTKPQMTIGYLSGTFDLFHIGHLNMLRRARQYCDYLVVGVHKDASHKGKETFIPFEERVEILKNIKYVNKVIQSEREDSDVYIKGIVKYDKLFVGSDYKGTERFNRYEEYFKDKGVEIIYFPYTQGTSSTQLRAAIKS
ncbi:MAG: SDR family NAD(P)-dependent oxidoreductase [Muribaculaceae bacterium]|nr:SDR family NAD(P)-dependent oxidoreductase [Muribaculaceae bacterium]